jgi:hypothetical protein
MRQVAGYSKVAGTDSEATDVDLDKKSRCNLNRSIGGVAGA